ncbi:MAG: FG-GAP repeat domain-containing protein [Nitrospinota bacterium]
MSRPAPNRRQTKGRQAGGLHPPGALLTISFLAGLLLLSVAAANSLRAADLSDVERLARDFATVLEERLRPPRATVLRVSGDRLTAIQARQWMLSAGTRFHLVRKEQEVLHPITGESLGFVEVPVGEVEAITGGDRVFMGRVLRLEKGITPKAGDLLTPSSRQVLVTILPLGGDPSTGVSYLRDRLATRLADGGKIQVVDEAPVKTVLAKAGSPGDASALSPKVLRALAEELSIKVVLVRSVEADRGGRRLRVRAVATRTGVLVATKEISLGAERPVRRGPTPEPRTGLRPLAPKGQVTEPAAQPKPPEAVGGLRALKRPREFSGGGKVVQLDFALTSLDVADTDGDGRSEVVLVSEDRVWRLDLSPKSPVPQSIYRRFMGANFIHVRASDINRNGKAEIFVTNHPDRVVNSFVLETDGAGYRNLSTKLPSRSAHYEIAGDWDGDGRNDLFWQRAGLDDLFLGSVHRAVWKTGRYTEAPFPTLPQSLSLYGFVVGDLTGDAQRDFAYLDRFGKVVAFSPSEKVLARSEETYGGSATPIYPNHIGDPIEYGFKKTRLVLRDLDGDGRPEILTVKNVLRRGKVGFVKVKSLVSYDNGRIAALKWTKGGLEERWATPLLGGYVVDFAVGDVDGEGRTDLVVGVLEPPEGSLFRGYRSKRSRLHVFPLQ